MLASFPTTFYSRLFCIFIIIGIIATCIVSCIACALDIENTREFIIENLNQSVTLAKRTAAASLQEGEPAKLAKFLKLLPHPRGVMMLCIYNQDNHMIEQWNADAYPNHCPAFVHEAGVVETLSFMRIEEPIKNEGGYFGMVYAQAELIPLDKTLQRAGYIFASCLLMTLIVGIIASYYGARHINRLIEAIRQQIECLKENGTECILPPANATSETMALFEEIRSLRLHLVTSQVPRETVSHLRLWYESVFFNLFSLLRHRVPEGSTALTLLGDCEMLLRFNADEPSPDAEVMDIAHLVEEGLSSARALNPPDKQVHLVVSFKPEAATRWKVRAGYLKAMVRHLLLIALARTRSGLVYLRLDIAPPKDANPARLVWRLEDSGPPMQPGVLSSRLTALSYKSISVTEASWLLVAQLTKRQGGKLYGECIPGGLLLTGEIPLGYGEYAAAEAVYTGKGLPQSPEHPRLILMLAESSAEAHRLYHQLENLNCRVFWAANPIQALEIAPAIPFSAVLIHEFSFSHEGHTAARRMTAMMENKLMPTIPLWIITASEGAAEKKAWSEIKASEILVAPAQLGKIAALCRTLIPFNARFWSACDKTLLQEYSDALEARLPEMRAELMAQIRRVQTAIAVASLKPSSLEIVHNAHAVKSAALALGYMPLAALMANLEYMLAGKQIANTAKNIALLADCLREIRL